MISRRPVRASTGPATQTVWFGGVVDRLNMLCPYNFPTAFITSPTPANFGNQWTPFNSSFGAFTAAPDGTTNTAQLLVEDTSNNMHFCQAGTNADKASMPNMIYGVLRIAAYFKAGSRTRAGFFLMSNDGAGNTFRSITVVFDLAGGQVGVPATIGGVDPSGISQIIPRGTQIIPMPSSFGGGGWYLCTQDMYWRSANNICIVAEIFLDQGTGTGALNNSYVGNGTSGAYVWRANMMPLAAYAINNQVFMDDFNSISTIDVNNTKAPGFNWYPGHDLLNYNYGVNIPPGSLTPPSPFPPSQISVANSVLTLTGPADATAIALGSIAQVNAAAGTYVGQGWGSNKPTLFEVRRSIGATSNTAFWGSSLEWIILQGRGIPQNGAREYDFVENSGHSCCDTDCLIYPDNNVAPLPGHATYPIGGNNGNIAHMGFPPWISTFTYSPPGGFQSVISGGVVYTSNNNGNLNHPPPNATFWNVNAYPGAGPIQQPPSTHDPTQMHLFSSLCVPFWGQPGVSTSMNQRCTMLGDGSQQNVPGSTPDLAAGIKFDFCEGVMVSATASWGPNLICTGGGFGTPPTTFLSNSDLYNIALWLDPGPITGATLNIDFVRVMQ